MIKNLRYGGIVKYLTETVKKPRIPIIYITKFNLDCYSLQTGIEIKYPLKSKYDPNRTSNCVEFEILPRMRPFYNGFMSKCEYICRYARDEHENPSAISDFAPPGFIF